MSAKKSSRGFVRRVRRRDAPARSERTREAILEAALDFLWSHPFRELTVGELMSRTSTSRPAFYQYFRDLHDLMDVLLGGLERSILEATDTWFHGDGDPVEQLVESLAGLVRVAYGHGPILRAVSEASSNDERLDKSWTAMLERFDDAVTARIEHEQAAGAIRPFAARPVAVALNRMDAAMLIHAFGRRPRRRPQRVLDALVHVWTRALYGDVRSDDAERP
jgi:TetR/AcrR family transcriptional regulator, ethionamide resistance regulator